MLHSLYCHLPEICQICRRQVHGCKCYSLYCHLSTCSHSKYLGYTQIYWNQQSIIRTQICWFAKLKIWGFFGGPERGVDFFPDPKEGGGEVNLFSCLPGKTFLINVIKRLTVFLWKTIEFGWRGRGWFLACAKGSFFKLPTKFYRPPLPVLNSRSLSICRWVHLFTTMDR